MATGRPGRAQGLRVREVTRARLLETAEKIFLSRGYAETSVDAIAHAAGYTTGAVYSNFGGKADLFLAVLESTSSRELAAVRDALAAAVTDEQRLGVFTTTIVSDPDRWRTRIVATLEFLGEARHRPELTERIRAAQAVADDAIAEVLTALCLALGIEPPSDIAAATRSVSALINGYAVRSLYDESFDLTNAVSAAVNALLSGARADVLVPPTTSPVSAG